MRREIKLRLLKKQLVTIKMRLKNAEHYVVAHLGYAEMNDSSRKRSFFVKGKLLSNGAPEIDKISRGSYIVFTLSQELDAFKIFGDNSIFVNVVLNEDNSLAATLYEDGQIESVSSISVIGEDITFIKNEKMGSKVTESLDKTVQAFGKLTTSILSKLTIGVVGVSGTGSIVAEQLYRMQIGTLVLIDDDVIEEKNLGRILNSSKNDSELGINKAVMMKKRFDEYGLGSNVVAVPSVVLSDTAIKELAQCDIIFGCVDSVDGRHHMTLMSSYYVLPYFDVGVKLIADGKGSVSEVTTAAHYCIPGESTLMDRGVYNSDKLAAADLLRRDPIEYQKRLDEKYIEGSNENSPAVITVNMIAAGMVVNEMLSRIHPFRDVDNCPIETVFIDLTSPRMLTERISDPSPFFIKYLGKGDVVPLLGLPK